MVARTVSAPRIRASISGDSSTATTGWPSASSGWVIRPAPAPSSRTGAPGGIAACTISGSPIGGSSA
jgi:hypothetical protein